jgi:periplasmic protein TonB
MTNVTKAPLIISVAFIINILLFLLIHQMVNRDHGELPDIESLNFVEFIRIKQKPEIPEEKPKEVKAEEQPPPEKTPPPPELARPEIPKPEIARPDLPRPDIDLPLTIKGIPYLGDFLKTPAPAEPVKPALPDIDTDVIPTVRIKPVYPPRALRAGIEGVVTVEFIITGNGTVRDPIIVDANPPDIFDKAVLQAIQKWKFDPTIVDGKAVEKRARQDIRFTLKR